MLTLDLPRILKSFIFQIDGADKRGNLSLGRFERGRTTQCAVF